MAKKITELEAFNKVVSALQGLEADRVESVTSSVLTFLGVSRSRVHESSHRVHSNQSSGPSKHAMAGPSFSENRELSPKQFIMEKQPRSDVERIACLAYYLTHYRETPHFKTLDLSKLNTEAAQPKFSNAALGAQNAVKQGYLAPSTKGQKQLSAPGELYVSNLPDREAAKAAMTVRVRRKKNVRKLKKDKAKNKQRSS